MGRSQRVPLGPVELLAGADRHRGVRDVARERDALAARDRVVARVAGGRHHVRGEVQLAALEAREPLEHRGEGLLRGVGCVLGRAGDPVADVVGAALVAVVERREGGAVAGRRAARERLVRGVLPREAHGVGAHCMPSLESGSVAPHNPDRDPDYTPGLSVSLRRRRNKPAAGRLHEHPHPSEEVRSAHCPPHPPPVRRARRRVRGALHRAHRHRLRRAQDHRRLDRQRDGHRRRRQEQVARLEGAQARLARRHPDQGVGARHRPERAARGNRRQRPGWRPRRPTPTSWAAPPPTRT